MANYYESFNSRVGTSGSYDLANTVGGQGCSSGGIGDTSYSQIDDGGRGLLAIHPSTTTVAWTALWAYSDGLGIYAQRLRAYIYLYGYPASSKYIVLAGGHYTDYMCSLIMDSTGKVAMYHNGNIGTWSSSSVPLNTQVRVEVNGNAANIKGGVWTSNQSSTGAPDILVTGTTSAGFYLPVVMSSNTTGSFLSPYTGGQYIQGDAIRVDDSTSTNWIGPETQGLLWSPHTGNAIKTTTVVTNKRPSSTTFSPSSVAPMNFVSTSVDRLNTSGAIVNKTVSVIVDRLNSSGQIVNKTYTTNNGAVLGP